MYELPSKYDVIPIHTSDVASFLKCRRYWDWSSPARNNLRHKVQIFGVKPELWFGTGIHYALEKYYDPGLQRDPTDTFIAWFELQWAGGLCTQEELDLTYELEPKLVESTEYPGPIYKVRGLRDLLPDPNQDEFMALRELGIGMTTYYREYAEAHDDFKVIAAEAQFSVPLVWPADFPRLYTEFVRADPNEVVRAVDIREDSPNYDHFLEVHARGKRDMIYQNLHRGWYGLFDHKTASKVDEDQLMKLAKDPQCTNYIWASQEEAIEYDLPYKEITGITYQMLRKVYPKPPSVLSDGRLPSLDRSKESCTAEMFVDFIKKNNLSVWFENNDKARSYYEFLVAEGDRRFIWREPVRRNKYEIANCGRDLAMIAVEMLNSPLIYPHPTGDWSCVKCVFRGPCIAADDGSDWKGMLADGYEKNRDR